MSKISWSWRIIIIVVLVTVGLRGLISTSKTEIKKDLGVISSESD